MEVSYGQLTDGCIKNLWNDIFVIFISRFRIIPISFSSVNLREGVESPGKFTGDLEHLLVVFSNVNFVFVLFCFGKDTRITFLSPLGGKRTVKRSFLFLYDSYRKSVYQIFRSSVHKMTKGKDRKRCQTRLDRETDVKGRVHIFPLNLLSLRF